MIARISSQWPRLMTVIRVASSHQTSTVKMPTVAARLAMNATRIARLISVIIPGCRATSSSRAPRRNTRPPIAKTAVAKSGGMRSLPGNAGGW